MSYDQQPPENSSDYSSWNQPQSSQFDQPQWQQSSQPQQTQYDQPQWQQPPQPQFDQPQWQQPQQPQQPNQYNQYNQYNQPQYGANQYGVPSYAQAQPQSDQTSNFLTRWLMMGLAIRIVLLVVVPLLLCGGCALFAFFASMAHP